MLKITIEPDMEHKQYHGQTVDEMDGMDWKKKVMALLNEAEGIAKNEAEQNSSQVVEFIDMAKKELSTGEKEDNEEKKVDKNESEDDMIEGMHKNKKHTDLKNIINSLSK